VDHALFRRARLPDAVSGGLAALLVVDGRIAWIGPESEVGRVAGSPAGSTVIDLDGALLLPGFVDAHVHVTETGLLLAGVDLSTARSVVEVLDLVALAGVVRPGRSILGHGWDELRLAEGRAPTAAELDRASGGGQVYLSRVDVHSAVVSGSLAERFGLRGMAGWDESGRIERDAHHAARHATRFSLAPAERRSLQLLALHSAAAAGISELHEMSAPHVAPPVDLCDLMALVESGDSNGSTEPGAYGRLPDVVPYRGELAADADHARRIAAGLVEAGLPWLAGLAGDLMVDGSIGSRTAALSHDYTDAPGHRGHLYLTPEQVRDHVIGCTRAGLQAGFHVIGDAAVDSALAGFAAAARVLGLPAIRAARHRVEHLEIIDAAGVATAARLGLIASVQPAFDAAWGGTDRMYAIRLGARRAVGLNPFAAMTEAGLQLAFGSDSPVTPFAPWEGIRAALLHRTPAQRIDLTTAIQAHTAGGRAAGRRPGHHDGGLRVGAAATFACWLAPELPTLAAELIAGAPAPRCLLTVIDGRIGYDGRTGHHLDRL
jgi:predicted amidohydrolase YtcJ